VKQRTVTHRHHTLSLFNHHRAAYYVGYVEDGETVEMIMKKFEVLDKLQQAKKTTEVHSHDRASFIIHMTVYQGIRENHNHFHSVKQFHRLSVSPAAHIASSTTSGAIFG
jgi:hypothetical protein